MTDTKPRRFDADRLAALEEERDFLLGSLRDLEAELGAGDIDQADYEQLKDDYTRRAASVLRAIDGQQQAMAPKKGIDWKRAAVWLVSLALLGAISGVLLARASGTRTGGESATGEVRESVVSRLNQARALLGDQTQWDQAIELYQEIVDEQPSNTEALTYQAWLQYRRGDDSEGPINLLREATSVDPAYADATVFLTIVLADAGRYEEAADALRGLDPETTPEGVGGLVAQRGLVGEVFGEAVYPMLNQGTDHTLESLNLTVSQALNAAGYLLDTDKQDRTVAALMLYRAVNEVEADNTAALSRRAMLMALTFDPDLLVEAEKLADQAVASDPDDAEALLTRVTVLVILEDPQGQLCDDVATLLALSPLEQAVQDQLAALDVASRCELPADS